MLAAQSLLDLRLKEVASEISPGSSVLYLFRSRSSFTRLSLISVSLCSCCKEDAGCLRFLLNAAVRESDSSVNDSTLAWAPAHCYVRMPLHVRILRLAVSHGAVKRRISKLNGDVWSMVDPDNRRQERYRKFSSRS